MTTLIGKSGSHEPLVLKLIRDFEIKGYQMLKPLIENDFIPILIKDLGMVKEASNYKYRKALFICSECTNEYTSRVSSAKIATTSLCPDCSSSKNGKKSLIHGLREHKLYSKWRGIKKRCYLKTSDGYPMYGAKGVTMCDEWKNDFKAFYDWCMISGYEDGLQIDKDILCKELKIFPHIYSPKTCKWVTLIENLNHRNGYKKCQPIA